MIGYQCRCGMSHVDKAYKLEDVTCVKCGRKGAKGKIEITKDNYDYLSEISWAWRFMKDEPMDWKGCLVNGCWGFEAGTPFHEIADWFVEAAIDFISLIDDDEDDDETYYTVDYDDDDDFDDDDMEDDE